MKESILIQNLTEPLNKSASVITLLSQCICVSNFNTNAVSYIYTIFFMPTHNIFYQHTFWISDKVMVIFKYSVCFMFG